MSYSDLKCEQLAFEKYEKISGGRRVIYKFYFEDHNSAFLVDKISQKMLDKTSLNTLSEGDTVKVYYKNKKDFFGNYSFEICEITYKNKTILSLKDYKTVNQNNQLLGIIICPICCLIFFSAYLLGKTLYELVTIKCFYPANRQKFWNSV